MSDKSGVSAQAITLPSGGGALQGLGETFKPDLFTGTANFTVPLALPAGRKGFQPQLALGYSTGSGNGPFGLGWQLSLPEVSRKTSKGVPLYDDFAADPARRDTFILSGAEDLVPVAEPAAGITRFRPRTEGLFARIEHVQAAGEDFWQVHSKDGLVSQYGSRLAETGEPAVVADPTQRARIFDWQLRQTSDPFGNRIEYEYLRDSGAEGPHNWDQLYLQRVRYVDYEQDGQARFLVSVTFVYAERPDKFADYRAGFEIRTRLRCKRVEIRTHAEQDRLARAIELVYLDERVAAGELPRSSLPPNGVSLLSQVQVIGIDEAQPAGQQRQALPPLEFGYTPFDPDRQRFQPISAANDTLPPRSLADPDFEMVSLFANGLPDLVQMNGAVQFWRNLGNGQFAAPQTMHEVPAGVHLRDAGVHFADMNGNGRADLLALQLGGYFPLGFGGRWSPEGFVRYAEAPTVSFGDQELRLVDLDGDGVTDALRTGQRFELFFNHPPHGWDDVQTRARGPLDDFPDLKFSDPQVKLADMTGDKLQDFVLVEQDLVSYWPYLGHGRWGRRIKMEHSPVFRDAIAAAGEGFDPRRVQLGDLDGDGLDDILYVDANQLTFWINQGGERWSDPCTIEHTPRFGGANAVRVADMLGTGMAGVLWTFDQAAGSGSNFRFLDLTGGLKPYLLEQMNNHMGAVTRVQYAPSTQFYLADLARPQTRWQTLLPFPVQVVERVEVVDALSGGKLTTRFSYHHGYWDGAEREFRGFGRVEQFDTEEFEAFHGPGLGAAHATLQPVDKRSFSPPLLTKTWFHLGPMGDEFRARGEADFSPEYWPVDPPALARPLDTERLLRSLPATRLGDALRALRGQTLRTELFALDGSERQDRPFTVTESQYGIREESAPAAGDAQRLRIFFPHLVAQRITQWERGDEPLTQFTFVDDYDSFGQPRRHVSLAVPRGRDYRAAAPAGTPYLATLAETRFAQVDEPTQYIVDRAAASTSFEIVNDGSQSAFNLYRQVQDGTVGLALFARAFNYYDGEPFVGLPTGQLGSFGALVRSESLVLTEQILREAYRDPADPSAPAIPAYLQPGGTTSLPAEYPLEFQAGLPALAGYTFADGTDGRARGYFVQSTRLAYDFHGPDRPARGLPVQMRDPLGSDSVIAYDRPFHLLTVQVTDAAGLTFSAEYDYRVLKPRQVTDVNGNRRAVDFNPLGMVTASAIMGKEGEQIGDTLADPGMRLAYDFFAFAERGQPVSVRITARLHHIHETDVPSSQRDATLETVEYSDGFGRLLQTRTQAEDVLFGDGELGAPLFGRDVLPASQAATHATAAPVVGRQRLQTDVHDLPNVVVSGWQLYNNKSQVVEKFEPFFSRGFAYLSPEDEQAQSQRDVLGQKGITFYDAHGRSIRIINPDGSEQRVVYGIPADLNDPEQFVPAPWEAYTYDANDLAPLCVGPDGTRLIDLAAITHHFTPGNIVIDPLGRTVLAVARNREAPAKSGDPLPPIQELRTHLAYDIRGNLLSVTDPLDRVAFRYTYDLANHHRRIESIDGGLRRMVLDSLGNQIERRDSKGALMLSAYDHLARPIRLWARDNTASPVTLRERLEYGDGGKAAQTAAERVERQAMQDANLLGRLHRHYDEAGVSAIAAVDFKGNVIEKSRRVVADVPIRAVFEGADANSWRITPFQINWESRPGQTFAEHENKLLEPFSYQTTASYDALNRVKRMQLPQDVEGRRRELRPVYNRAGGLEQVHVDDALYVERITYDAKAQRTMIAYGNPLTGAGSVITRYAYDPHTFRLKRLRSEGYSKVDDVSYGLQGVTLQDFAYDYDLMGNLINITDRTPESGIRNNPQALAARDPDLAQLLARGDALVRRFDYDPIYRLLGATGRECDRPPAGPPFDERPRCSDLTKARAYVEQYRYDAVGNMLRLEHHSGDTGFTREFTLQTTGNRLQVVKVGDIDFAYTFDDNGNMLAETTSRHFEWNHTDQMKVFRTQTEGAEPSVHVHYLYDAAGQRVKKLVRRQGGQFEVTHYIDGVFEHHRWGSGAQAGENNHVHVLDNRQRIALARLGAAHPEDRGPAIQFHLSDHQESSNLILDADGALVNREEFTPYGETSFGSFARKRYRFTGIERDEESGLTYHGARYCAPTLGRWLTCDPLTAAPSRSAYEYASSSPINRVDPTGNEDAEVREARPVTRGAENKFRVENWQVETIKGVGDQADRGYWVDNSYDVLNRAGLKAYLTEQGRGKLTSFEQTLVDNWDKYDSPSLTPFFTTGGAGFVGYLLETGGSGNVTHALYTRNGDKVWEISTEAPLVNMGLGPIDYIMAAKAVFSLAVAGTKQLVAKGIAAYDGYATRKEVEAAFASGSVRSGTMVEFSDKGGALTGETRVSDQVGKIWYHEKINIPGAGPKGATAELRTHSANPKAPEGSYSKSNYTTQINTAGKKALYRLPDGTWKKLKDMSEAEKKAAHYPAGN